MLIDAAYTELAVRTLHSLYGLTSNQQSKTEKVERMRVVALEEHFTVPALVQRIDPGRHQPPRLPAAQAAGWTARTRWSSLPEIGEQRLKSMDEAGITVQVLSNTGPGPDLVPGPDGVAMAREMNDHLAAAIAHASRPLRRLRRAADAEPGRLRRRARARRQGAAVSSAR